MMEKKDGEEWSIEEIEKALGDNVKLHNFDKEDLGINSGFNSEGFLFDGKNDYISITNNTIFDDLFSRGFTFEFLGECWSNYKDYDSGVGSVDVPENCSLFSLGNSELVRGSPSNLAFSRNRDFLSFCCDWRQ